MQKISRKRFEWLKQKHYELWDWLSKNPDKYKNDWFELDKNKGIRVRNRCFEQGALVVLVRQQLKKIV